MYVAQSFAKINESLKKATEGALPSLRMNCILFNQ